MRARLTADSLQSFIRALAAEAKTPARIYLVGGATAVLLGWRSSTIDLDLKIIPDSDEILRALPRLKEQLRINVELAAPDDFIPPVPGWENRSHFIRQEGKLSIYHYDYYGQALAKLERRHNFDLSDVAHFFETGLIEPAKVLAFYSTIESELYKYPAVNPKSFREAVEQAVKKYDQK